MLIDTTPCIIGPEDFKNIAWVFASYNILVVVDVVWSCAYCVAVMDLSWLNVFEMSYFMSSGMQNHHSVNLICLPLFATFDCCVTGLMVPIRGLIDQPISRESLASLNLVGDRAAHPLSDRMHCRNQQNKHKRSINQSINQSINIVILLSVTQNVHRSYSMSSLTATSKPILVSSKT